jgi:hypothetical protein
MDHPTKYTTVKAFELAYFVHLDHDLALQITKEALAALKVHLRPQRKRSYYRLRGRSLGDAEIKARTKITFENAQKLQLLVYLRSEQFERQQEGKLTPRNLTDLAHNLKEEDWVIRFIKHLMSITITRSSFYVTLGVSRVLFNYVTEESVRIYDAIIQDPNRMKDAPYFRKRKNDVLMKGLKERFDNVLQTRLVDHGEERFKCRPDGGKFAPLVNECLDFFTPWETSCVLPERLEPMSEPIDALGFNDDNPDEEHRIETRRVHTLIHPLCFKRLVQALGLACPNQRLEIPMFFSNQTESDQSGGSNQSGGNPPDAASRRPAPLTAEDFSEVEIFIQSEQERRKRAKPVSLLVMVDGAERTTLQLDHPPIQMNLNEAERLVEIKFQDEEGDLLLGSLFLDGRELLSAYPAKDYRLKLAGRLEVFLVLVPTFEDDEIVGANIEVGFRRARIFAGVRDAGEGLGQRTRAVLQKPIFALSTIAVLLATLVVSIVVVRRHLGEREYVAEVQPPPSLSSSTLPATDSKRQNQNSGKEEKSESTSPTERGAGNKAKRSDAPAEGTRSLPAELSQELSSLRRVHVESQSTGNDGMVRQSLLEAIAASGKLQALDEEHAEAFLLWEVKRIRGARRIEIRLLNRGGQTLWSSSRIVHVDKSDSTAAAEMVRELSAKIGP